MIGDLQGRPGSALLGRVGGIGVRIPRGIRGHRREQSVAHEPVQQLRVVNDVEAPAQLRVLPGDRVEAVRAGDDDPQRLGFRQGLNRLSGQHLEEGLVSGPARRVSRAGLSLAEDRERHAGRVQELRDRRAGLLRRVVVGTRASHPEEIVDGGGILDVLADDGDVEVELLRPVHALAGALVVGVRLGLHAPEGAPELSGEGPLHEHLVATQVQDVVDVLDVDGALVDARPAVRAIPQDLLGDDAGHQGSGDGRDALGAGGAGEGQRGDQVEGVGRGRHPLVEKHLALVKVLAGLLPLDDLDGGRGLHVVAQAHDEELGGEGLARVPRGAQLLAAPALGARVEIEACLPREVFDGSHAQDGVLGDVVEVVLAGDRLPIDEHVVGRPQRFGSVGVSACVQVEDGHEAVPGDAHAGLHAHDRQPGHRREDLQRADDDDRVRQYRRRRGGGREEGTKPCGEREMEEGCVPLEARRGAEERELEGA